MGLPSWTQPEATGSKGRWKEVEGEDGIASAVEVYECA